METNLFEQKINYYISFSGTPGSGPPDSVPVVCPAVKRDRERESHAVIRDCKSTNQPRVKDGEPVFPRAWIYCLYIVSLYSRVHMKGRKTVARASLKLWGHFCTNISKPCRGICELSDSFELFRHTFSATRNCFSTFSSSAKKKCINPHTVLQSAFETEAQVAFLLMVDG